MITGPVCLLVFAKVPRPGRVKTRLTPPLTPQWAARLYDAFLRDALDQYAAQARHTPGDPEADPFGLGEPASVRVYLDERPPAGLVPDAAEVHLQVGTGLGERMAAAFATAFADGFERVVVVGTDHPTLPPVLLGEAFRQLREPMTCVLSPSDDGGYVFLGLNDLAPGLFDMEYSHTRVFRDTLEEAHLAQLSPVVLPGHYDVDDADDLRRLIAEWEGGATVGARTADLLSQLPGVLPAPPYLRRTDP
ncbi:MAG: TIGR04282 family arsenosugar biosynthesis glycosyltransferase [Bacteroidota bacterium]